jgi:hypothetical protein
MKRSPLAIAPALTCQLAGLLSVICLVIPASANPAQPAAEAHLAQSSPTSEQVRAVCAENQAETLANPFMDVPSNHWAYKAVLTMYYCGANHGVMTSPGQKSSLYHHPN